MCLCLEAEQKQKTLRELKIHFTDSSNEIRSVFFFLLIDSSFEFVLLRYVFVFLETEQKQKTLRDLKIYCTVSIF